jgi:hypothetical protein
MVCNNGTQAFVNVLVRENEFTQVVDSLTRGNALLDVYMGQTESSFTANSILKGISGHYGVIFEIEWEENCYVPQAERLIPVYQKRDVLDLQNLLLDKFGKWTKNASCVEVWNNFKEIVTECIECFFPRNILSRNPDPEYYNKEVKRLKIKFRKACNKRKLGEHQLK